MYALTEYATPYLDLKFIEASQTTGYMVWQW